jgi:small subunit ribosomal protein S2
MMANIHDLRFRDKKRLARFIGFVNHRKRLPGAGFIPTLIDNIAPADEFQKARLQSVGIIDSNVSSLSSVIPIPGNDDSIVCINFYCYILSRAALAGKIDFVFL